MKTITVITLVCAAALSCAAAESETNALSKVERMRRATGGFVYDRRDAKGQVVFVSAQKTIPIEVVSNHVASIENSCMITMSVATREQFRIADAQGTMKDLNATIAVFLVEGDEMPFALAAMPDSRFAVINIKTLASDSPDAETLARRVKKSLSRAVAFAFGAGYSVIGGEVGMLKPAASLSELDEAPLTLMPPDTVNAIQAFAVKHFGFKPFRRTVYLTALKEGWAPPPKGEYQRNLWEKHYAIPAKPMKIEFDPKKGR